MTKKQWLIGIVLADFLALNAYVVMEYGYMGFVREVLSTVPGIAVLVDLTIALTLVAVWMVRDAKRRGLTALPYLAVTVVLGSVGPLLYLLRTSGSEAPEVDGASLRVAAQR